MTRDTDSIALGAVLRLHMPVVSTLEAVSVGGDWRELEPDSFEDIIGRETICESCLKPWPCATIQAIRQAS